MINYINNNVNVILEIQNYLINLRNIHPSLPEVYPTGIYDETTANAIIEFQNIMGLPPTGTVDILTWNALIRDYGEYLKRIQAPGSIPFSATEFVDVKRGDQRDIVYAIKIMLNNFHRRYANYIKLDVTNLYDEQTEESVKLFQERSMLPVTGIVDKNTWDTMVAIYNTCRFYL
jgi:peptidoglycan hydrolase-like protein with peptidoglycan-binding domain